MTNDPAGVDMPCTLVIGGKAVDGRTTEARRYKAICADLATDLGATPSTAEWALIQRAAGLMIQSERIECAIATGGTADVDVYCKLVNSLGRVLTQLGTKRRSRDITPGKTIDAHAAVILGDEQ